VKARAGISLIEFCSRRLRKAHNLIEKPRFQSETFVQFGDSVRKVGRHPGQALLPAVDDALVAAAGVRTLQLAHALAVAPVDQPAALELLPPRN